MRNSCDPEYASSTGADTHENTQRIDIHYVAGLLDTVSRLGLRYGMMVVLAWIGAMKFTTYEAEGISGLVSNSPLMAWAYGFLSHRQFSIVLGLVELTIAALIAFPKWHIATMIGAVAAVGMFLTTLTFMATTPGVFEPAAGGFPALSVVPGQFLVKDIVLLAASVWLLADAINARFSSHLLSAQNRPPVF